jgi:hypothetical protein
MHVNHELTRMLVEERRRELYASRHHRQRRAGPSALRRLLTAGARRSR